LRGTAAYCFRSSACRLLALQMTVRVGKLTVRVSSDEAILLDAAAAASSLRSQSAGGILSQRARQQRAPAKRSGGRTSALGGARRGLFICLLRNAWSEHNFVSG